MINLETPRKLKTLVDQARYAATEVLRPNSRRYDRHEHTYPTEMDMLAELIGGVQGSGQADGAGAAGGRGEQDGEQGPKGARNGANLATVLGVMELCWGDTGLMLSMPGQGLGNAAIAAVADDEQLQRFGGKWAAMAITEPECGSDSGAIKTTAVADGDEYVLSGEKIFVTAGERAEVVVVWATMDRSLGKSAIKSFIVERDRPGFELVRLEHKLGIKASDTAHFRLDNVRVPKENLLGSPEIDTSKGFAGVMQTFDNTRPMVAAMAVGVARAALEATRQVLSESGIEVDYDKPVHDRHAAEAEFLRMESDWESAYLLTMQAAWMADNKQPNSLQASMSKAKSGRTATEVTLRCVELCSSVGYGEAELFEKWARDAKILDIFEGTQQIQQLIVARRLLNKSSAELK